MKSVNIINLGCSKNLVDSEFLARQLEMNGYSVVYDQVGHFPFILINTCGFIHDAQEESIQVILESVALKNDNPETFVGVFGCLTALYKQELSEEIPEVDAWFGKFDSTEIVKTLNGTLFLNKINERKLSTPSHYAYLKVSEGCDRKCAFCSIPKITGGYTSVPINQLVEQAKFLATNGVKEIILIAQDLTWYGRDLPDTPSLTLLIQLLSKIDGIEWIRLHYAYPVGIPDDLFDEMRENPKVCKYIDIPVQHISDNILASMKRGHNAKITKNVIENIRNKVPGISIRTTMMVGFPGETDKEFEELLQFTAEARFERMGAFTYSHEENTFAYDNLNDIVSQETKEQRLEQLMELQHDISEDLARKKIGSTLRVIIDRYEDNQYYGRTEFDSPDVDSEVIVQSEIKLQIGSFYMVEITDSQDYDLIGKVVKQ